MVNLPQHQNKGISVFLLKLNKHRVSFQPEEMYLKFLPLSPQTTDAANYRTSFLTSSDESTSLLAKQNESELTVATRELSEVLGSQTFILASSPTITKARVKTQFHPKFSLIKRCLIFFFAEFSKILFQTIGFGLFRNLFTLGFFCFQTGEDCFKYFKIF